VKHKTDKKIYINRWVVVSISIYIEDIIYGDTKK